MSLDACARLVERGDPDRYLAVMAAPPALRPGLMALYAFNLEVARAPWVTAEPLIAQMRLQWWRDALDEIAGGKTVRRHEVVTPLAEVLTPELAGGLTDIVSARSIDIAREPFVSDAALLSYLSDTSGRLLQTAAALAGARIGPEIGTAQGLANWLMAVPALTAAGWTPLPDPDPAAVAELARQGLALLASPAPRAAKPALLATFATRAILSRAARQPETVSHGLALSPARRHLALVRVLATGRP